MLLMTSHLFYIWSGCLNLLRFALWPKIWSILMNVYKVAWKRMCILLSWDGVCINARVILLVDDVIQIFYIFDYFLFSIALNSWERDFEVLQYNLELSVSPFKFYQFLLWVFQSSVVGAYTFRIALSSWCVDFYIIM